MKGINNLRSVVFTAVLEPGNLTKRIVMKHTAVGDSNHSERKAEECLRHFIKEEKLFFRGLGQ